MASVRSILQRLNLTKILPLMMVIGVGLVVVLQNIDPHTYYTGWDNVHPEFNLPQYAYRVLLGAWFEFQGLGAPAAQSYLADIPRLPIIFLLKLLVPDNLNRYIFIFMMFITGGIGTFIYLKKIWLHKENDSYRDWIAALGAIYYLLNLVTLQQFYIAFEMFTVQFAFFPFLLLSIHFISKKISPKSILVFFLVQFLIAPSAHQPVLFYLGAIFSLIYSFFLSIAEQKNLFSALKMTLFLGLLTLFANSYWVFPNLYYLLQNTRYVSDSRANALFGLESLWSVREAGKWQNLLIGAHYLFDWKDFNFINLQPDYIFDAWRKFLANDLVLLVLAILNIFTLGGFIETFFDFKKGSKRWGMVAIYLMTFIFMWMGLVFPRELIDFVYRNKSFLEAFRNPVTKFSIVYSFTISIFLANFVEALIGWLRRKKVGFISTYFPKVILASLFLGIIFISWPSFTGSFLNDKLKVSYPSEYSELFSYLKTRPENFRVLELPFFTQAGWSFHQWFNEQKPQGYQGMGFYWFGFPQPLITPDFARWVETNDFFYYELRQTLNTQNSFQLKTILSKYNVDLIIVDETAIDQYNKYYDYENIYQLLKGSGAKLVWRKNFLSVYERPDVVKRDGLVVPTKVDFVQAQNERVRRDYVYEKIGGYINNGKDNATLFYPFSNLSALQVDNAVFEKDGVKINRKVPLGDYVLKIPGTGMDFYKTLAAISFKDQQVHIVFPKTKIITDKTEILLPQLKDIAVGVDDDYEAVTVWINDKSIKVNKNQTVYSLITANFDSPIQFALVGWSYAQNLSGKQVSVSQPAIKINTTEFVSRFWNEEATMTLNNISEIQVETEFPVISADLRKQPSENCSFPVMGTIATSYVNLNAVYAADGYGVNCDSYSFDFLKADYGYLMRISGKNFEGRSLKFIINYNAQGSLPEEYLAPSGNFSMNLVLFPILAEAQKPYLINWETRSYGKLAKNQLNEFEVAPLDVERLSQVQLEKLGAQLSPKNEVVVKNSDKYFNFLYFVQADCKSQDCYLGIDQSYDRLWLALSGDIKLLPHYRYNNWANIWEINRSGKILIVYLPQAVSLVGLFLVAALSLILAARLGFKRKVTPEKHNP